MEDDKKVIQPTISANSEMASPKSGGNRKILLIALSSVAVLVIAGLTYKLYNDNQNGISGSVSSYSDCVKASGKVTSPNGNASCTIGGKTFNSPSSSGFQGATKNYSDNIVSFKYPEGWGVVMKTYPAKPNTYYLSIKSDYAKGTLASTGSAVQYSLSTFIIIKPSSAETALCEGCTAHKSSSIDLDEPKGPFSLILANQHVEPINGEGAIDGDAIATINSKPIPKDTKDYNSFIVVTNSQKMTLQSYAQYTTNLNIQWGSGNHEDEFQSVKDVTDFEQSPVYTDLLNILATLKIK